VPDATAPASELAHLVDLAVRAAHAGGHELLARAGRITGVGHKSSGTDPVSDSDRASEQVIVGILAGERPADGLLGEEGADRPSASGTRWVVDPLDGTVNYLYGLPHTTVSIACQRADGDRWETLAGVVHDPARDETFAASRGGGAFLDGTPISVNRPAGLRRSLIATGFSYDAGSRARQARTLLELLPRARDIRSHGSAALELCWVAAGRCDGYYEDELAPWDLAAGALIAREAGALVSSLGSGVLAAEPALHDELLAVVGPPAGRATL
jgi:myo-inositol-1(or 4)-monophosphatase